MRYIALCLIALAACSAIGKPPADSAPANQVPAIHPSVPQELLEQRRMLSPDEERPEFLREQPDEANQWLEAVTDAAHEGHENRDSLRPTPPATLQRDSRRADQFQPRHPQPQRKARRKAQRKPQRNLNFPGAPAADDSSWSHADRHDAWAHDAWSPTRPPFASPSDLDRGRATHGPEHHGQRPSNRELLFHAAFELEKIAHQLELRDLPEAADRLHKTARELRSEARETSSRTGTPARRSRQ